MRRAGDESGFTLIELAVSMALLVVVGLLTSVTLLGARSVIDGVAWRAEANSDIRQLIDQTFADLAAARPLAQCELRTLDGTCEKITESRAVATDPESGSPSVLTSATASAVCYRSQRKDPVAFGDTSVTPAAWLVCLEAVSATGALRLVATPPSAGSTYDSDAFDTAATRSRALGTVDLTSGGPLFSYFDLAGAPIDPVDLDTPVALATVAKVELHIRLSYVVNGHRTRTRALAYTAALRSSRYEQERWWSGDRGTG